MEILASRHPLPLSPVTIKSLPIKNPNPNSLSSSHVTNPIPKSKTLTLISCSISASPDPISPVYNGWDDLELVEHSAAAIDLNPIRRFFVSLGFDDSKLAFTFFLGFVSALAVARVRLSSVFALLASILVFAVGFSAGTARFRVSDEKFRDLESFLCGLLDESEKGDDLSLDCLDRSKIRSFLEAIECVKKNVVGEILSRHLDFDLGKIEKTNPKTSKKRKEVDFLQYLSLLFKDNVIGVRTPKLKDNSKVKSTEQLNSVPRTNSAIVGSGQESVMGNGIEDHKNIGVEEPELMLNKNKDEVKASRKISRHELDDILVRDTVETGNDIKPYHSRNSRNGKGMLEYEEELNNLNRSFQFMTRQESFERGVFKHNYKRSSLQDDLDRNNYFGPDKRTTETMDFFTTKLDASTLSEETLEISDKIYYPMDRSRIGNLVKEPTVNGAKEGNMQSSSTSVDEEFSKYMDEATSLLSRARECIRGQTNEETVDSILYKSAKLLSAAETMRPMSLVAVGQLGNTYLLHGELKLKISRELRTLLSRSVPSVIGKGRLAQFKKLTARELCREDVESTLVEVCEECEELLVKSGRKYRTALSIDGNDVRALYNWGLALSFRAQLIADIGPEAALDADKIYLAAIDKFDAMMSRSNLYESDALYRWGTVLQQRSYLRRGNTREKIKLLHQAKSLFEDVLSMDSDNVHVREALVSCVSELNYSGPHW